MGQPYRPDLSRYSLSTHDVCEAFPSPTMLHATVGSLPTSSWLNLPNSQIQGHQQYPRLSPNMFLSASTYPQPIAPAAPHETFSDFIPSDVFSHSDGKGWGMTRVNGSLHAKEHPCTPVMGSQGRLDILPTVAGRGTPVTKGVNSTVESTIFPAKDIHGKFPCPHCNGTYLHVKHLKRHILRREYLLTDAFFGLL